MHRYYSTDTTISHQQLHLISTITPNFHTLIALAVALFLSTVSSLLFGAVAGIMHSAAHVLIGAVLLFATIYVIYATDSMVRFR